ncbi:hypothetical protein LQV63_10220 [Paenibacillus profundus]|uniref:Uncharacterized protein n=1 Tax=Paenibacillus profundus TaxID=1173085 RepID=A0ABS8YGS2_9BACL|nr:hypothetical protein [Paenibacillus profundus]MCE5169688.1 hypothetical protein [Paenibacillus profundus]
MNLLPQVSKKNRLAFLLAVGLLVLLIAGGLLWQTQHQSESFDALIQKMAFDTLKDDPEKQLYFDLKNVEGIRWDPTKLTDLSDADYEQLNEKRNGFLKPRRDYVLVLRHVTSYRRM